MEQVWSWLTNLSSSSFSANNAPLTTLPLATNNDKSILLQAEKSENETHVTLSISLTGFKPNNTSTINPKHTLWLSQPFLLSSPYNIHYHFLIQLAQEIITRSPSPSIILPNDQDIISLDVGRTVDAFDGVCISSFFSLVILCRLFWLCTIDAPSEAGLLFFHAMGSTVLEKALNCKPAMRIFFRNVAPEWEDRFMRSVGFMLAKWCILLELQAGPTGRKQQLLPSGCCLSYVSDTHGYWILRGYAPVSAMSRIGSYSDSDRKLDIKDYVLKYILAHQQMEAVIQLECRVSMQDPRFISINVRVDNIRLRVVRLGFAKKKEQFDENEYDDMARERHFPSRIRIWVGPEEGSTFATGLSLSKSMHDVGTESQTTQVVEEKVGKSCKSNSIPTIKSRTTSSIKSAPKGWVWDQEAEGNTGIFEGVLCCDGETDHDVGTAVKGRKLCGAQRGLSKNGGVVVCGDELGGVSWRVGREMEGRVVKLRVGGRVWLSYVANNKLKSEYFETRFVEWREEVDLPLVGSKN